MNCSVFSQFFKFNPTIIGCIAIINTRKFAKFLNMSTSSSPCRLVCLQRSHDDIPLLDGITVNVGRSPATKIIDPRCSRNQVALTCKWSKKKVKVQQLGSNPSSVDGTDIGVKKEVMVGEDATIFILTGQYPHKVVFAGSDQKEDQQKTDNKTKQANNITASDSYLSSVEIKQERENGKRIASKRMSSSSESGQPDSKRKKCNVSEFEHRSKSTEKKDISNKGDHEDKNGRSESVTKRKKESEDGGNDEGERIKTLGSKLEMLQKKVKTGETTLKGHSKEQSKSSSKSSSSSSSSPTMNPSKKSSSSSSSSSSSMPSIAKENKWTQHEHLFVFTSKGVEIKNKIAGFDVDGTIILTKSGKTFPIDAHDWRIAFPEIFGKLKQLHKEGFKIVFFTNQLGIARGKIKIEDLKTKLENIVLKLQVPVQIFVATHEGKYRKPVEGMWKKLKSQYNGGVSIDSSLCVYIGDAAGRPVNWEPKRKKDFSSSDRLFALNIGVDFQTPEEFFLKHKKAPFTMPAFDPRTVSSSTPLIPPDNKLTLDEKELIVLVGYPASGKSHVSKHILKPKGYVIANRDTLGSWQKCVKVTNESLVNSSVVVDNTNLTPEERKRYLDCAKTAGVPCRCFVMTTTFAHCRHNEKFREMTDSSHAKINEMIFNQAKSKYKEPAMSEGFSEIVKVNFVPKFSSSTMAADYKKFIMEK